MLNPAVPSTPEAIFETINWAMEKAQQMSLDDRRITERTSVHLPVFIHPVDEDPVKQQPFEAITHDISVGGICFTTQHEIKSDQICVNFAAADGPATELCMNVHYCNKIGPFYFTGTSFFADWSVGEA